jgi:outer membrane protein assembly factor BamB
VKEVKNMKPKPYLLLIALLAVFTVSMPASVQPAVAQAVDEPWPQWHHDPANTGVADGSGPKYLTTPKWTFETDGAVVSSPAIAYGNVYIGSNDKNLYCLDAQTGTLKWEFKIGTMYRSSPAVKDGKVYIGPDDGTIYCLDAYTGSVEWKYKITDPAPQHTLFGVGADFCSSPCIVGNRLYVGHFDNSVYCLDTNTGAKIWNYTTGKLVIASPAVADGMLYIASNDGRFYKLRADDGKLEWSVNFDDHTLFPHPNPPYTPAYHPSNKPVIKPMAQSGATTPATVVLEEGIVYTLGHHPGVVALDIETGELIWRRIQSRYRGHASREQAKPPANMAYRDGKLYYVDSMVLMCGDAKTGEDIWPDCYYEPPIPKTGTYYAGPTANIPVDIYGDYIDPGGWIEPKDLNYGFLGVDQYSSPSIAGDTVYIGTASSTCSILAFNAETGLKTGWYCSGGWFNSSPSIAYGQVYIGDSTWNVYCFSEGQPRMLGWPSPDRAESTITADLSSATTEIRVGDWVAIEGAVTPMPIQHGRGLVVVTIMKPDGWAWEVNGMTNTEDGGYRITYHPDMEGTYTATAEWWGDDFSKGAEAAEITFTVLGPPAPPAPPAPAAVFPIEYYYVIIAVVTIAVLAVAAYWYIKK